MEGKISARERWMYGLGCLGQNAIFFMVSSFMLIFYTDVMKINAAAIGAMFLLARTWDAVDDPAMGIIVDRTRTRWGKFRPYILFAPILTAIAIILCFTIPNFSESGKLVYAYITYIFYGIAYSAFDVPYWSMVPSFTRDPNERTKIILPARIFSFVGGFISSLAVAPLVKTLGAGNDAKGYQFTAIIFSVIMVVTAFISFKNIRERVSAPPKKNEKFRDSIFVLIKNPPLLIVLVAGLMITISSGLRASIAAYYFKYIIGSETMVSLFLMSGLIPSLLAMFFAPALSIKIGKRNTYMIAAATIFLSYFLSYFVRPQQVVIFIVLNAISGVGTGLFAIITTSMQADTVEYAEWKTGKRSESIIFSVVTFMAKFALAIAGSVAAFSLALIGFVPNVKQPATVQNGLFLLMTIIPAAIVFLSAIVMFFYRLDKSRYETIVSELEERRKQEEVLQLA